MIRVQIRLQKGVGPVVGDSTIACDFSDSDLKPIYYLIESVVLACSQLPERVSSGHSAVGYFLMKHLKIIRIQNIPNRYVGK